MKIVIVSAVGFLVSDLNYFIINELHIPIEIPINSELNPSLTNS